MLLNHEKSYLYFIYEHIFLSKSFVNFEFFSLSIFEIKNKLIHFILREWNFDGVLFMFMLFGWEWVFK